MKSGRHIHLRTRTEGDAIGIDEEEIGRAARCWTEREQSIDGRGSGAAHATDDIVERGAARSEYRRSARADTETFEAMEEVATCEFALRFGDRVDVAGYAMCAASAHYCGVARTRTQSTGCTRPTGICLDGRRLRVQKKP